MTREGTAANGSDAGQSHDLAAQFGQIDVYLFDQLLRGRIQPGMRVLDAGCGRGRNVVYLLRTGFDVHGVDRDRGAIAAVRSLATRLASAAAARRFRVADLAALPYRDRTFDLVIANAVLHFAPDQATFHTWLQELWRVMAPGAILFVRTASSVGIENQIRPVGNGRFALPDGTVRFLVSDEHFRQITQQLGSVPLDPIKTTVVHGQRAMTTWCAQRR